MLMTKRKPATVGEILIEEFMRPDGSDTGCACRSDGRSTQAGQRVVQQPPESDGNRRKVTAATALILARVFGNSPDFWLNVQRRSDLWEAMNSP